MNPSARSEETARRPATRAAVASAIALLLAHLLVCGPAAFTPASPKTLTTEQLQLRLDPNVATAAELELLPGVGPRLAQAIIDYRESTGAAVAFRTPEDLARVPRIGPVTVERLRRHLRFAGANGPVAAADAP